MRIQALSLVDHGDAGGEGKWEIREVDLKVVSPKITSAALLSSDLAKGNLISDDEEVFSRTGVWRGPLSGLPKSTLLELPTPPQSPPSAPTLELVLLPKGDHGSLVLSLARAQLSVPLIRGGRHAFVCPSGAGGGGGGVPAAALGASSVAATVAAVGDSGDGKETSDGSVTPAAAAAVAAANVHASTAGDGKKKSGTFVPSASTSAKAGAAGGATAALSSLIAEPDGNLTESSSTADAATDADAASQAEIKTHLNPAPSGPAAAGAAAAPDGTAEENEQERETWGLDTDAIALLTAPVHGGGGGVRGREERKRLARTALRAGDVDRLLLCLGRLEGEAPPVQGGRADRFDDPAAVAERARRRAKEGKDGDGSAETEAADAPPMWSPPFPPEEFDSYDDEVGMESQDSGVGAGLGGFPPYHAGASSGQDAEDKRQRNGGTKMSAYHVQALHLLLEALGADGGEDGTGSGEERGEGEPIAEREKKAEAPREHIGAEAAAARPSEGARDCRDTTATAAVGEGEGGDGLEGGACSGGRSGGGDLDNDSASDEIAAVATAALDGSCLRSVCRQYLFGVDWRFVSTHQEFYLALLRLLEETLRPFNATAGNRGRAVTAGGSEAPRAQPLARSLLDHSADCPGMVDLLDSLCVALDDLVACPPQSPPPASPAPTHLPQPTASPAVGKHLPPPSPASPLKLPLMMQLEQLQNQYQHLSSPSPPSSKQWCYAKYHPDFKNYFMMLKVGMSRKSVLHQMAKDGAHEWILDTPDAMLPLPGGEPAAGVVNTGYLTSTLSAAVSPAGPTAPPPTTKAANQAQVSSPPVVGDQQEFPPPIPSLHGTPVVSSDAEDGAQAAAAATTSSPATPLSTVPPSPPPAPPLPLTTPPGPGPSLDSIAEAWFSASTSTSAPVPGWFPPTPTLSQYGGLPSLVPIHGAPGLPEAGKEATVPQWSIPTPPPLPPPPPGAVGAGSTPTASMPFVGNQMAGGGGRLRELPPAVNYEEEQREHEQGVAMAALARSVLALARSAVAADARTGAGKRGEKDSGATGWAVGALAAGVGGAVEKTERHGGGGGSEGLPAAASVKVVTEAVPSGEALYLEAIGEQQFATMRMEASSPSKEEGTADATAGAAAKPEQQHHFWRAAKAEGSAFPARQRRLVRELRSLARELPLYWGSTIAVRMDEEHPHLIKAMIAAPAGTPYDSGLFEFDIYCPPQYPSVPPKVNLMTTGQGRVRFSPNLYACGNVCLSLLGTWSGSPEMMWSPDASLLQVLLSIQTFILGAQYPYYNEPGLELDYGHPGSMDRARSSPNGGYEVLRPQTVEWAMAEALRAPPRGFEVLVREHFWRKKWHILDVVADWLRESKRPGGVQGHYRALAKSLKSLLIELIRLSDSMGDCPYVPPRPPPAPFEPVAATTAAAAAAADRRDDPSRAEYFAAVRGLFGPEAGPPSDNHELSERKKRRRRRVEEQASSAGAAATAAGPSGVHASRGEGSRDFRQASENGANSGGCGESSGGGHGEARAGARSPPSEAAEGQPQAEERGGRGGGRGVEEEKGGDGGALFCASCPPSVHTPPPSTAATAEADYDGSSGSGAGENGHRDGSSDQASADEAAAAAEGAAGSAAVSAETAAPEEAVEHARDEKDEEQEQEPRRWETPAEARERLRLRLKMAWRGAEVATAAAAATAAIMARSGSRRSEGWAAAADKAFRLSGVLSLHGRALEPEDAASGGRAGITWSSHPQFRKYFTLLRLGIPREEVAANAVRNGVPPSILDRPDETVPLSTSYSVVSPCAPLLRISPDLNSQPCAQLNLSSGTIFTADPSKVFATAATGTAAETPATPPQSENPAAAVHEAKAGVPTVPPRDTAEKEAAAAAANGGTVPATATSSTRPKPSDKLCPPASDGADALPSMHPLVLLGRRVWVVSPVVGWASVWAETGQSILTPAAVGNSDEESDGRGEGGGEKRRPGKLGAEAAAAKVAWPGLSQDDVNWLNPYLSVGKTDKVLNPYLSGGKTDKGVNPYLGVGKADKAGNKMKWQKKVKVPAPGKWVKPGKAASLTKEKMAAAMLSVEKMAAATHSGGSVVQMLPDSSAPPLPPSPYPLPSSWSMLHGLGKTPSFASSVHGFSPTPMPGPADDPLHLSGDHVSLQSNLPPGGGLPLPLQDATAASTTATSAAGTSAKALYSPPFLQSPVAPGGLLMKPSLAPGGSALAAPSATGSTAAGGVQPGNGSGGGGGGGGGITQHGSLTAWYLAHLQGSGDDFEEAKKTE